MPPRKRAAPAAPTARGAKRSKKSTAEKSAEPAPASVDLTAQNSTSSPLLRLPAELRNKIWFYAYGNTILNVTTSYSTSGLDLPDDLHYTVYDHTEDADRLAKHHASTPGLVCKQFWFETSQVFLTTATFSLDSPTKFRALAVSTPKWLRCVRKLLLPSHEYNATKHLKSWADSLTSSHVGRFTHLEGVVFEFTVYRDGDGLLRQHDITDKAWERSKLPSIIRAFQQHKLKAALTSFAWILQSQSIWFPDIDATAINGAIRTELLKHHPRRLSRRGKDADEDGL